MIHRIHTYTLLRLDSVCFQKDDRLLFGKIWLDSSRVKSSLLPGGREDTHSRHQIGESIHLYLYAIFFCSPSKYIFLYNITHTILNLRIITFYIHVATYNTWTL